MANLHVAFEVPNFVVGIWPANADLSAAQFCAVEVVNAGASITNAAGGAVNLPVSAGFPILGVLQNAPVANEAATIMIQGISKAKIGGTVHTSNLLMSGTDGKFVVATSGKYATAMALCEGSSGDTNGVLLGNWGIVA